MESARARLAARKARDLTRRKTALDGGSLPGKMQTARKKDPALLNCIWWRVTQQVDRQNRPEIEELKLSFLAR